MPNSYNTNINEMANNSSIQNNPIHILNIFLEKEQRNEQARKIQDMHFVGYPLELGYEKAKVITSDPYKMAVGGIPRGSFLIMTLANIGNQLPHFTLLRVTAVSPTPLNNHVQQTYFELHKKSMPELDVWTQSELQWGALDCDVLGMFYANPKNSDELAFSGDVNNVASAHKYKIYAPNTELLNLIVNGIVKEKGQYEIGKLRVMECNLRSNNHLDSIPVNISIEDFKGCRTAMFGKTRLGKSNTVKLIAQNIINATKKNISVGQVIFDVNGEYANDTSQDNTNKPEKAKSLRSANEKRCFVYALSPRKSTPSKPLRLNFFEQPSSCMKILRGLLEPEFSGTQYVSSFYSVQMPSIEDIKELLKDQGQSASSKITRMIRKIQMYWAILGEAGFEYDDQDLIKLHLKGVGKNSPDNFDPKFNRKIIEEAYKNNNYTKPQNIEQLKQHLKIIKKAHDENNSKFVTSSGNPLFDADDLALLEFLSPKVGNGPRALRKHMRYHNSKASNFIKEILNLIEEGMTVILDLGNATHEIRRYFADLLSKEIFSNQENKFTDDNLGTHYVQLYFEEAHNLFPPDSKDLTGVYARLAKEGAKFHIGMVYSTQSPSTINKDLLAQTENFFVGHLSSQDETKALSRVQIAFSGTEQDILKAKTPGYMRMLTLSNRFVIPVQVNKYEAITQNEK